MNNNVVIQLSDPICKKKDMFCLESPTYKSFAFSRSIVISDHTQYDIPNRRGLNYTVANDLKHNIVLKPELVGNTGTYTANSIAFNNYYYNKKLECIVDLQTVEYEISRLSPVLNLLNEIKNNYAVVPMKGYFMGYGYNKIVECMSDIDSNNDIVIRNKFDLSNGLIQGKRRIVTSRYIKQVNQVLNIDSAINISSVYLNNLKIACEHNYRALLENHAT